MTAMKLMHSSSTMWVLLNQASPMLLYVYVTAVSDETMPSDKVEHIGFACLHCTWRPHWPVTVST
eukprot:CAMPEP_0202910594 /NCGR_PEP_ID=MMETSP1392-20130828/52424_1 /ASSEMBLY_ACC=CAM_ASM_000868 /TAXON_ID=225041 /ORGANISM="Chlamydomonas chlamydogama, Strain SAG 11-48b" /LENGTH=64 /DNA_ID=CAMNT_0049600747 /DNA_START=493 /DNA_END=687 /DNA_ORIENTATION=-